MGQEFTAGSNAAIDWEPWLHANCPRLMLYARQQTRSQEDAEDVLQEALVQLVNTVESGDFQGGKEQWVAYAISAIRNLATDSIRRTTTRRTYEQSVVPSKTEENPWLRCLHDDELRRRHVETVLRSMQDDYAEVLILRIWEELTFQQIADVTGDNLFTITSRYRRALKIFRDKLAVNPIPE
ncbi:MAG: sigma-70 family RNA polymerase sigma factor [Akkermansia sp.]|nr:sigma-70 family RNA polymerase sigma factor [Akkermansia sp.]